MSLMVCFVVSADGQGATARLGRSASPDGTRLLRNCETVDEGITPCGWDPEDQEGRCVMDAQSDQAKGHAKEAAGLLTGNEELRAEGKAERVAGEVREQTDKVLDTVERGLDRVQHAVNDLLDTAKKAVHRS